MASTTVEYSFDALLPPPHSSDLHDLPAIVQARHHCRHLNNGAASGPHIVEIHDDKEIRSETVEVTGDAFVKFTFPQHSIHRYLTLHVKNVEKFMQIEVCVVDEGKDGLVTHGGPRRRVFKISNRRSQTVIETALEDGEEYSICELPMYCGVGWQMMRLDLVDLCTNAFGTERPNVESVTVRGSCFVSKIFTHKDIVSDAEMPPHLRAVAMN